MTKCKYPRPEATSVTVMFPYTRGDKIFDWIVIGFGSLAIIGLLGFLAFLIWDFEAVQAFCNAGKVAWHANGHNGTINGTIAKGG